MAALYSHDDHAASNSSTSYFTYPVRYAVSGVLRRLSTDPQTSTSASSAPTSPYLPARPRTPPYNPPPLAPLSLHGQRSSSSSSATSSQILSRLVAEEIRLLVPPRLQLVDTWRLVFSLEQHGASLGTLYRRCAELAARRAGFVLVVQDSAGGVRATHAHEYTLSTLSRYTHSTQLYTHMTAKCIRTLRRLTATLHTDLRRLPQRRAPPLARALLRHGRVLPVARVGARFDANAGILAAAAAQRGHDARNAHDDAGLAEAQTAAGSPPIGCPFVRSGRGARVSHEAPAAHTCAS